MAAAWQASGTLLGSTGADITPVNPAHAIDDILMLIAASRVTTETCLTPSGWTLKQGPISISTLFRAYLFWKRATSAAEANPLCDWSAATGEKYGQVHNVRGAIDSGDPFAAFSMLGDLTDPILITGLATTLPNQRVIVIGIGNDNASASVVVSSTDPATYAQNHFSTIATGADATGSFHSAIRTAAGATGNITLDHNSTMPAEIVFAAAMLDPVTGGPAITRRRSGDRFLTRR